MFKFKRHTNLNCNYRVKFATLDLVAQVVQKEAISR